MQMAVPDLMEIRGETKATRDLYALEDSYAPTRLFGRSCLTARRLVERGVRFVEVLCPTVGGDRWDQHSDLKNGHENNARAVDQPIAGLLTDLKSRGLLDSTLIIWGGEFGRTPMSQASSGRDHNPFGFTMWLAGGGIKGGTIHGATDDYGYHAVQDKGGGSRPPRHDASTFRYGSHSSDQPIRRPRHAVDRRSWRGRQEHPGLITKTRPTSKRPADKYRSSNNVPQDRGPYTRVIHNPYL